MADEEGFTPDEIAQLEALVAQDNAPSGPPQLTPAQQSYGQGANAGRAAGDQLSKQLGLAATDLASYIPETPQILKSAGKGFSEGMSNLVFGSPQYQAQRQAASKAAPGAAGPKDGDRKPHPSNPGVIMVRQGGMWIPEGGRSPQSTGKVRPYAPDGVDEPIEEDDAEEPQAGESRKAGNQGRSGGYNKIHNKAAAGKGSSGKGAKMSYDPIQDKKGKPGDSNARRVYVLVNDKWVREE